METWERRLKRINNLSGHYTIEEYVLDPWFGAASKGRARAPRQRLRAVQAFKEQPEAKITLPRVRCLEEGNDE